MRANGLGNAEFSPNLSCYPPSPLNAGLASPHVESTPVNAVDLITKKRNGEEMSSEDLAYIARGAADGTLPDYQLAAWLMSVWFRGMTPGETFAFTDAIARGGRIADLSSIPGVKVDKHSTGGVGDKTTLIVAPIAAAGGVPIAKMAGRGLGFTGGTLDKLESIPGLRTDLSPERFVSQVREIGAAVIGAGPEMAPADKKLYALRDVTATVDSIPLIAASVMSKKLAGGADAFVLDVKLGAGAFMKSQAEAEQLAGTLLGIARRAEKKAVAMVTAMDQPLGLAVGNALEVAEATEVLRGTGERDLTELCLALAGTMLWLGGKAASANEGSAMAEEIVESGAGLDKFRAMIAAQGGDPRVVDDPGRLPHASVQETLLAPNSGFVVAVDALQVGRAAMALGAGRERKEDSIDPAAGILLRKKLGDAVNAGEKLAVLHTSDPSRIAGALALATTAFSIGDAPPAVTPLIRWVGS